MLTPFPGRGWPDAFPDFRRFQEDLNRALGNTPASGRGDYPPVNVWTGDMGLVIMAEVPGFGPDSLEVTVHENVLTLKGTRKTRAAEQAAYHRQERYAGTFSRSIALPFEVDTDKVDASFRDGILTIHLPRPKAAQPRRIPIATS